MKSKPASTKALCLWAASDIAWADAVTNETSESWNSVWFGGHPRRVSSAANPFQQWIPRSLKRQDGNEGVGPESFF